MRVVGYLSHDGEPTCVHCARAWSEQERHEAHAYFGCDELDGEYCTTCMHTLMCAAGFLDDSCACTGARICPCGKGFELGGQCTECHKPLDPKGIEAVYDNGGSTVDRYTVLFTEGQTAQGWMALGVDAVGGKWFSQYCECTSREQLGTEIHFRDLPTATKKHIRERMAADEQ